MVNILSGVGSVSSMGAYWYCPGFIGVYGAAGKGNYCGDFGVGC